MADTYRIPERYQRRIESNEVFKTAFKNFLNDTFPKGWTYGSEITTSNGKEIIAVDGSTGWVDCLMSAFKASGLNDVGEYYMSLEWAESDLFDYEIEKIIMGTTDEDYDLIRRD